MPRKQSAIRARRLTFVEPLEDRRLLAGESLVISELMAINDGNLDDSVADFAGENTDWIEIHNPTATSVNVGGWYLTDDPGQLTKWTLPNLDIPEDGYLLVYATGKNLTENEPHTNFQLNGSGEYLALIQPDGLSIAHQFAPQFPPQQADISSTDCTGEFITPWNGPMPFSFQPTRMAGKMTTSRSTTEDLSVAMRSVGIIWSVFC